MSYLLKAAKLMTFLASWTTTMGVSALSEIWDADKHLQFQDWVTGAGRTALENFIKQVFEVEKLTEAQTAALNRLCERNRTISNTAVEALALHNDPDKVAATFRMDASVATLVFVAALM